MKNVTTVRRGNSGHVGQISTAKTDADEIFLSAGDARGRARYETHVGTKLSSLSLLARGLCPYSPRMSRVAPSDGNSLISLSQWDKVDWKNTLKI